MDNKKPFSHPRWRDNPEGETTEHVEMSEEDKQKGKEKLQKHLKKIGVLKDDK